MSVRNRIFFNRKTTIKVFLIIFNSNNSLSYMCKTATELILCALFGLRADYIHGDRKQKVVL
jgi:hypothetical protein